MNPLIAAIGKVGLQSALIGYLVYMMAGTLPKIQSEDEQIMSQHTIMLQDISDLSDQAKNRDINQEKLLRGICLILASNNKETQLCNP